MRGCQRTMHSPGGLDRGFCRRGKPGKTTRALRVRRWAKYPLDDWARLPRGLLSVRPRLPLVERGRLSRLLVRPRGERPPSFPPDKERAVLPPGVCERCRRCDSRLGVRPRPDERSEDREGLRPGEREAENDREREGLPLPRPLPELAERELRREELRSRSREDVRSRDREGVRECTLSALK